jgi:hypothetical protein
MKQKLLIVALMFLVIPATAGEKTKIIPWGEANREVGGYHYTRTRDGLLYWRTVVDEAIVTTDPRIISEVMTALVNDLSPMRVIPGADVNPVMINRVDRLEGWKQVAKAVELATRITGQDRFVINFERTWRDMRLGKYAPDWDAVRAGLKLLPHDVRYIWYPSISCWVDQPSDGGWCDDDLALQTEFLRCVVETLPSVSLVTFEHRVPGSATYSGEIARQAYVHEHFPDTPTFPIVYFEPDHWPVDQIVEARDTCKSDAAGFYFGVANWARCAEVGPVAVRKDLERRFVTVQLSSEAAEAGLGEMRERAESAEGKLSRIRELVGEVK